MVCNVNKNKLEACVPKYNSSECILLRIYVFDVRYIECFSAQKTLTVVLRSDSKKSSLLFVGIT